MKLRGYIWIVVSLFIGCKGETNEENIRVDYQSPLGFSSDVLTRGLDDITTETLAAMGVFTYYTGDADFNETASPNYMYNLQYTRSASNYWETSPPQYWPYTGKLSFFAYTPFTNATSGITVPAPGYSTGMLTIRHTPNATDLSAQCDFCVATPIMNKERTSDAVHFRFFHTLTKVSFSGKYKGTLPSGAVLKVEKLSLKNVIGSMTLRMTDDAVPFLWDLTSVAPADYTTYTLSRSQKNELFDLALPSEEVEPKGINLSTLNGRLFLLPQTLTGEARLEITYLITAGGADFQYTKEITLPVDPVWKAGKGVNYLFTIDVDDNLNSPIELTPAIVDWQDAGNHHDEETIK